MALWIKRLCLLVLTTVVFTDISAKPVMARQDPVRVYASKPKKKKKTEIQLKKGLVKDFGKKFGKVNSENGGKLSGELLYHGEFQVPMKKLGLSYIFTDYDEFADYELTDEVPMNKIEGSLGLMVTGFKKKTRVSHFVKSFKKSLYGLKAKVLDGEPTSYYVSERYAELSFKLKKKDKRQYYLRIALDEKDQLLPESYTWLTYKD